MTLSIAVAISAFVLAVILFLRWGKKRIEPQSKKEYIILNTEDTYEMTIESVDKFDQVLEEGFVTTEWQMLDHGGKKLEEKPEAADFPLKLMSK